MRELLNKARARAIRHLVLDKGALALTIGMGGFVLLLLAGTQVLDWYWPVLLAAVSLGIGVYQIRNRIPTRYELAQRIDHRMVLADSLSTAVYFSEHPKPGFEAICAAQFRAAEGLAGTVNLEQALPLKQSRYVVPAAVLLAAAVSLFGVRYFMMGSLDLSSSLMGMAVDTFFSSPPEEIAAKSARPDLRPRGFDPTQPDAPASEEPQQLPPDAEKGKELTDSKTSQENATGDQGDEQGEEGDSESSQDGPQDSNKQPDKSGSEGEDNGGNDSQSQEQRNMFDKLRDAMNNLLNKANSNGSKQKSGQGDAKQKGEKSEKGEQSDENQSGDEQQADANQQGEQSNDSQGKQSQAAGQKQPNQDPSAAGQQEGKKTIEEALAEEAMGKVSEILIERSAAVSGEMTIEVGQTKQQLRTAMTQQKAGHTDPGGEIHRDQVPLADQTFVERYFQEIRKAPAKK